jgi:peptide deformylase
MLYGPKMVNVVSDPVWEHEYDQLPDLVSRMTEVMKRCDGIGLSAPQIGVFKNVFIMETASGAVSSFVNPKITAMYGKEVDGFESCLSIPPEGNGCIVSRMEHVEIMASSASSPWIEKKHKMSYLQASVVQHETDHLFGTFFVDRASEKNRNRVLAKYEQWYQQWLTSGRPFPF